MDRRAAHHGGLRSVGGSQTAGPGASVIQRIQQDIPITYVNNTGMNDPEFKVVVFTKAGSDNNVTAWKVLQAQSGATFSYPVSLQVAALYPKGGATETAGPFPCSLGDTWQIKQASATSTPLLSLVDSAGPPDTIVVKNMTQPTVAPGNPTPVPVPPFSIQLIKDGSPLVTQPNVGSCQQAVIQLTPTIYFGIVQNVQYGAIFNSLTNSQYNTPFQLQYHLGGLQVTLSYNNSTGKYTFTSPPVVA